MNTEEHLEHMMAELCRRPDRGVTPGFRIAVLSTPRCGSSLFCDAMSQTGRLGEPLEYFNPRYIAAFSRVMGRNRVNLAEYKSFIENATTSPNGIFSVNIHVGQVEALEQRGLRLPIQHFDHVIYLWRQNRVRQAYSLAKANATDQWSADLEQARELTADDVSPTACITALYQIAHQVEVFEQRFRSLTAKSYVYETFAQDPAGAVADVAGDIGVDAGGLDVRPRMQRQSEAVEEPAYRSFLGFLGAGFDHTGG